MACEIWHGDVGFQPNLQKRGSLRCFVAGDVVLVVPHVHHQVVDRHEHREEVGKNADRIILAEHEVRQ